VGLGLLRCLHLNDSKATRGSRLDRHEWIGEGRIGSEAFRRIMRDPALMGVVKIIETPKGDDAVREDRRMLRRLRGYASGPRTRRHDPASPKQVRGGAPRGDETPSHVS
jgi:endonuclease IV